MENKDWKKLLHENSLVREEKDLKVGDKVYYVVYGRSETDEFGKMTGRTDPKFPDKKYPDVIMKIRNAEHNMFGQK